MQFSWRPFASFLTLLVGASAVGAAAAQASNACEVPIRWRIADVDPRFGITVEQASDAVRQAGMLWEDAIGRPLLFQESSDGIPVRFIYDERQQSATERLRRSSRLDADAAQIEDARIELEAQREALDRVRTAHERRALDFRERLQSHGEAIEYWNRVGGAPPDEFQRLRELEEEIEDLRRTVNEEAEEINRMVGEINAEADRINRDIAALNQARNALERELPRVVVRSAEYRELRGGLGGIFGTSSRQLHVFHFEDRNHLIRVIAHELGHALGLEHSAVTGSLMTEVIAHDPDAGRPQAHPVDGEDLRRVCPRI